MITINQANKHYLEILNAAKFFKNSGCMFQYFEDDSFNGRTVTINGRQILNFGSCSYLGLEKENDLINSSIEAVKKYGTQTPSSRAVMSSPLYTEAEDLISKIFPGYQVMTQTVTLGHFSILPLFVKPTDALILDAYAHNSIRMAGLNCKAMNTMVLISKHNNIEHIKYLTYRLKKDGYDKVWYCADGIYSIHGDKLKVKELHNLLDEEKDLYAYIDDAHGTGWTGQNGSGYILGHHNYHEKTIVAVSFAKSFAACGGALIFPSKETAQIVRMTGQTLLFSGPLQPAILGALIASAKIHLSSKIITYQKEIIDLISFFRSESSRLNLPIVTKDMTPIQLLQIGNKEQTGILMKKMNEQGFISMAATYPAVAEGDDGIRISLTRHLKKEDISNFLNTLATLVKNIHVDKKEHAYIK